MVKRCADIQANYDDKDKRLQAIKAELPWLDRDEGPGAVHGHEPGKGMGSVTVKMQSACCDIDLRGLTDSLALKIVRLIGDEMGRA